MWADAKPHSFTSRDQKTFLKVDADLDIKKEKKLIKKTEYHFRLNLAIEQIYILIFFVFLSLLRISVSVQTSASIRPFFFKRAVAQSQCMINMYLSAVCPAVWLDGTFISQWIYYIKKKSTLEGECSVLCRKHCKILSVGMCPCLLLLFSFFLFYVLSYVTTVGWHSSI